MATDGHTSSEHGARCSSCGGACKETVLQGIYKNNPVTCQVLGICSCLAVTNRLANALVMTAALVFVCIMSNLFLSLLRHRLPHRIRMIVEVAVIATFVIFFDQFLKAFYWEMSKQLGPYVGLIITNCIVMGRAEAFAILNPPLISMVDGLANALGYGAVLAGIALLRELVGSGTVLGFTALSSSWYEKNLLFILAPGAFFTAGFLIWIINAVKPPASQEAQR